MMPAWPVKAGKLAAELPGLNCGASRATAILPMILLLV
jgi:hypothetical protein